MKLYQELYQIFSYLSVKELCECRLVSGAWTYVSTKLLLASTGAVKLKDDRNAHSFAERIEELRIARLCPFDTYSLNFRSPTTEGSEAATKILAFLKSQICRKLIIAYPYYNYFFENNGHHQRRGSLNFQELMEIEFNIVFDKTFAPDVVNTAEIMAWKKNTYMNSRAGTRRCVCYE